ncbi:MAG: 5'-nucleotidase C-terminal domain-containing protein [Candidatus Cryptobacteroides sp.]
MKRTAAILAATLTLVACAPSYSWKAIPADSHRTGVTATTADNVTEALGTVEAGSYQAPNGTIYEGGCTPDVALLLIQAQPQMRELKQVIGYAPKAMERTGPECELYDFAADAVLEAGTALFGEKMDVAILNKGGVRCDVPQGDILLDDIISMFPFNNCLCLIRLKGSSLREIFTQMAQRGPEIIGGARIAIENRQLVNAEIGGQPLDDDKVYNLVSIDFLLNGGDRYFLAKDAVELVQSELLLRDAILPAVKRFAAESKPFEYKTDGRVKVSK